MAPCLHQSIVFKGKICATQLLFKTKFFLYKFNLSLCSVMPSTSNRSNIEIMRKTELPKEFLQIKDSNFTPSLTWRI